MTSDERPGMFPRHPHRQHQLEAERRYTVRPDEPHGFRCRARGWAWVYLALAVASVVAAVLEYLTGDLYGGWIRALLAAALFLAFVEAGRANVAEEERFMVAERLAVLMHGPRRRTDPAVLDRLWDEIRGRLENDPEEDQR